MLHGGLERVLSILLMCAEPKGGGREEKEERDLESGESRKLRP